MTGLEIFVLGLFTNGSYDVLKRLFGASFDRLKRLLDNNNESKFTETLKIVLEGNAELIEKLEELKESGDGDFNSYVFHKDSKPRGNFGNNGVYNEK